MRRTETPWSKAIGDGTELLEALEMSCLCGRRGHAFEGGMFFGQCDEGEGILNRPGETPSDDQRFMPGRFQEMAWEAGFRTD